MYKSLPWKDSFPLGFQTWRHPGPSSLPTCPKALSLTLYFFISEGLHSSPTLSFEHLHTSLSNSCRQSWDNQGRLHIGGRFLEIGRISVGRTCIRGRESQSRGTELKHKGREVLGVWGSPYFGRKPIHWPSETSHLRALILYCCYTSWILFLFLCLLSTCLDRWLLLAHMHVFYTLVVFLMSAWWLGTIKVNPDLSLMTPQPQADFLASLSIINHQSLFRCSLFRVSCL